MCTIFLMPDFSHLPICRQASLRKEPLMNSRNFAMFLGVIFVFIGIAGFIPGLNHMHSGSAHLTVEGPGTGYLLGLFHVNVLHNAVHILFGVMGIAAARGGWAVLYCRIVAVAYILLAVMGSISTAELKYTFGLIPIEDNDVWLHALIGIAAAVFGWVATGPKSTSTPPATA